MTDLGAIERASRAKQRADSRAAESASELERLVIDGLRNGLRPADVVRASGWSATYVRRIARKAGIAPARETP